jgi:GH24 family phage-related lysozyme (muramidase)
MTIKQEGLRKNIKDYDQLPKKYQLVLTNIAFNVGSVTEDSFPKLLKAIRNNNDALVRKEMLTSYVNDETKKRIYLTDRRDKIADTLGIR